jgi:hypothetical protein
MGGKGSGGAHRGPVRVTCQWCKSKVSVVEIATGAGLRKLCFNCRQMAWSVEERSKRIIALSPQHVVVEAPEKAPELGESAEKAHDCEKIRFG